MFNNWKQVQESQQITYKIVFSVVHSHVLSHFSPYKPSGHIRFEHFSPFQPFLQMHFPCFGSQFEFSVQVQFFTQFEPYFPSGQLSLHYNKVHYTT